MKKAYEGLEMEVIRFSTEDIITTSDAATDNNQSTNEVTGTKTVDETETPPTGPQGNFRFVNIGTFPYVLLVDEEGNAWSVDPESYEIKSYYGKYTE